MDVPIFAAITNMTVYHDYIYSLFINYVQYL